MGKGEKARSAVNVTVGNGWSGDAGPRVNAGKRGRKATWKRGAHDGRRKPGVMARAVAKAIAVAWHLARGGGGARATSVERVLVRGFARVREVLVAVVGEESFGGQECSAGKPPPGRKAQAGRHRRGGNALNPMIGAGCNMPATRGGANRRGRTSGEGGTRMGRARKRAGNPIPSGFEPVRMHGRGVGEWTPRVMLMEGRSLDNPRRGRPCERSRPGNGRGDRRTGHMGRKKWYPHFPVKTGKVAGRPWRRRGIEKEISHSAPVTARSSKVPAQNRWLYVGEQLASLQLHGSVPKATEGRDGERPGSRHAATDVAAHRSARRRMRRVPQPIPQRGFTARRVERLR